MTDRELSQREGCTHEAFPGEARAFGTPDRSRTKLVRWAVVIPWTV